MPGPVRHIMRRSASSVRLYAGCLRQVQGQASKSGPWARGLSRRFTGPHGERPASRSLTGHRWSGDQTRPEASLCAAVPVDDGLAKAHPNVAFCATALSMA
jgi:hypothetical protein